MHYKGSVGKRHYQANGDFTEGFKICEPKGDSEWFDLTSIFPLVQKAVKKGGITEATIKDRAGTEYKLVKADCEIIVRSYLDEVFGYLQGCSAQEQLKLLKDQYLVDLLTVPLSKPQIKELKSKGIIK